MLIFSAFQSSIGTNLTSGICRFYSIAQNDNSLGWLKQKTSTLSKASIFCAVVLFGLILLLFPVVPVVVELVGLSCVLALLYLANAVFQGVQAGARNRRAVSFHQCFYNWGRFGFAALLLFLFRKTAVLALVGFIFATTLTVISQIFVFKMTICKKTILTPVTKNTYDKEFTAYLFPLILSGLFMWLLLLFPRVAMSHFGTLEDAGIYFAYYQISFAPLMIASKFLSGYLKPLFFSNASGASPKKTLRLISINARFSLVILVFVGVLLIVSCGLRQYLADFLVAEAYRGQSWMLPFLVFNGGLFVLSEQLLISLHNLKKTGLILLLAVVGGLSVVLFCVLGGCLGGVGGILAGSSLAMALYTILCGLFHRNLSRRPPNSLVVIKSNSVEKVVEENLHEVAEKHSLISEIGRRNDFIAPRVITCIPQKKCIIMEKVSGITSMRDLYWAYLRNGVDKIVFDSLIRKCGESLASIHNELRMPCDCLWEPSPVFLKAVERYGADPDKLSIGPTVVLHGDYGFANVFFQGPLSVESPIVVIDPCADRYSSVQDIQYGPAHLDVAKFLLSLEGKISLSRHIFLTAKKVRHAQKVFLEGYISSSMYTIDISESFIYAYALAECYFRKMHPLIFPFSLKLLYNNQWKENFPLTTKVGCFKKEP